MSYLKDFQTQITNRDFSKFLQLWEEYCNSDFIDSEEFIDLLKAIKKSDFAKPFGQFVETALPLLQLVADKQARYDVLKYLIDLQTTNSPVLSDTSFEALKEVYSQDPLFNERIRLVGLRGRDNFQQALSNYDLLAHMGNGKYVLHVGGWGAGEIIDLSPVRQQITIEFENVGGRKHLTFDNAFKTLLPLKEDHFLVRRFSDPDLLEKEAKENPVETIKVLLRDLGPLTAADIKDELCELVIPEQDWAKWWQGARAKIKKDLKIESPETIRDAFRLRKAEISQEERFSKAVNQKTDIQEVLQSSYNFVKDLPNLKKNQDVRNSLRDKLIEQLANPQITPVQELQICILLESQFSHKVEGKECQYLIMTLPNLEEVVEAMEIVALKKRALTLIREHRKDSTAIFLKFFFLVKQSLLRDYLLKELNQEESLPLLKERLQKLLEHPEEHPECFVWYFQKVVGEDKENIPFHDKEGQSQFFEAFFVLYSNLETRPEYRDLLKKMYALLCGKRYAIVRAILEGSSLEFAKEFLLLASKCTSLSDHDLKTLRSLVEVVHPTLATKQRKPSSLDSNILWTTEEGYLRTQEQVKRIGTTEIVENAREIEAARALGDLRENSEYKFALEKRSRLQGQLKTLSEQLSRARIITKDDISSEEVGVGSVIEILDAKGNKITYTILGPWEADPDKHILSIQSKLAEAMLGLREGDKFKFREEEMKIVHVKPYL